MQVQLFGQSAENLVVNGDYNLSTPAPLTASLSTLVISNGTGKYTGIGGSGLIIATRNQVAGKYYAKARARVTDSNSESLLLRFGDASAVYSTVASVMTPVANQWYELSAVGDSLSVATIRAQYPDAATQLGKVLEVDYCQIIDLTATFGAGNEPTKEQCDILFANYFEGTANTIGTGRVRSVGAGGINPSSLYFNGGTLRSNGLIKDEIRKGTNGYELVKRISDTIILNGSENWTIYSGTLTDTVIFRLPIDGIKNSGVHRSSFWQNITSGASVTDAEIMQSHAGALIVRINKSRLSTLDVTGFKAWLTANNQTLNYELTTPIITPIAHAGLLNSNSNGTVYFEPAVADAGVYDSNMPIQLTDFPISTIESISKYENGLFIPLNPETAVIASGGLSFTHPDLASGDLVTFTYLYSLESTGRSMTLTYYDSRYVVKDTANADVYKITPKITSGELTWELTLV
jgi:hypothetical protein